MTAGRLPEPTEDTITAAVEATVDLVAKLFKEALESEEGIAELDVDDDAVTLIDSNDVEIDDQTIIEASPRWAARLRSVRPTSKI